MGHHGLHFEGCTRALVLLFLSGWTGGSGDFRPASLQNVQPGWEEAVSDGRERVASERGRRGEEAAGGNGGRKGLLAETEGKLLFWRFFQAIALTRKGNHN